MQLRTEGQNYSYKQLHLKKIYLTILNINNLPMIERIAHIMPAASLELSDNIVKIPLYHCIGF